MAKPKQHHVVPSPTGGWNVKKAGAERASKHFETKDPAEAWGRSRSQREGTELVIHRRDGTIERKDSHGRDPMPPRDKR
jgi:hypothetical protein